MNMRFASPERLKRPLPTSMPGFLGISFGNTYYSQERIKSYIAWAKINCPDFAFLLGDYIYAFTYACTHDTSLSAARDRAKSIAQDHTTMIARCMHRTGVGYPIISWSELRRRAVYQKLFKVTLAYYRNNAAFQQDVWTQVQLNLGNWVGESVGSPTVRNDQAARNILSRYVLHEIAGLVALTEYEGRPLEVYPGADLWILKRLYSGQYELLADGLLPGHPQRSPFELVVQA